MRVAYRDETIERLGIILHCPRVQTALAFMSDSGPVRPNVPMTFASILAAPVLCNGPKAEVSEELREGGGQVVGVEATGVGKNPGVAAAEKGLLEADAGVFDTRDDTVGVNADKGDDGRAPASDFGLEPSAAGAKFVVGEFIRAGGGAFDDVGDAEPKVEKKRSLKGGKEARSESAAIKGRPEAIARAAKVAADGGGVEAGVDAREEDDEIFRREIRDDLVARGEDLAFAGFPGSGQCPMHRAASSKGILPQSEDCTEAISGRESQFTCCGHSWTELSTNAKTFFRSRLVKRPLPYARFVASTYEMSILNHVLVAETDHGNETDSLLNFARLEYPMACLIEAIVVLIVIVIVAVAMSILGLLQRWGVLSFSVVTAFATIVLVNLYFKAYREHSRIGSIKTVICASAVTVLAFGLFFWIAANFAPKPPFVFDQRLIDAVTLDEMGKASEEVRSDSKLVAGLLALRVYVTRSHPDFTNENVELSIGNGWKYSRRHVEIYAGDTSIPSMDAYLTTPSGETINFERSGLPGSDNRLAIMQNLVDAKSEEDLVSSIDRFTDQVHEEDEEIVDAVNKSAQEKVQLNLLDFIYFSICTFTTVGTGDILPATSLSRTLVALESVMSLTMLAFGVDLLSREIVTAASGRTDKTQTQDSTKRA